MQYLWAVTFVARQGFLRWPRGLAHGGVRVNIRHRDSLSCKKTFALASSAQRYSRFFDTVGQISKHPSPRWRVSERFMFIYVVGRACSCLLSAGDVQVPFSSQWSDYSLIFLGIYKCEFLCEASFLQNQQPPWGETGNHAGMFQEGWLSASDHSFTADNLEWKSYKPDALKHGCVLALPRWAHKSIQSLCYQNCALSVLFSDMISVYYSDTTSSHLPVFLFSENYWEFLSVLSKRGWNVQEYALACSGILIMKCKPVYHFADITDLLSLRTKNSPTVFICFPRSWCLNPAPGSFGWSQANLFSLPQHYCAFKLMKLVQPQTTIPFIVELCVWTWLRNCVDACQRRDRGVAAGWMPPPGEKMSGNHSIFHPADTQDRWS